MKNLVVLYCGDNRTHAFDRVFGGKSAFALDLEWADKINDKEKLVVLASVENKEICEGACRESASPFVKDAHVVSSDGYSTLSLLQCLSALCREFSCDDVIYSYGDRPFLNQELGEKVIEYHRKYIAEYTFADGYPAGLSPEMINSGTLAILSSIAEKSKTDYSKVPVDQNSLFTVLKEDINSFEIEAVISPKDFRLDRMDFSCRRKRGLHACMRLFEAADSGTKADAVRFSDFARNFVPAARTLPAFYNVQIHENLNSLPLYSAYAATFAAASGKKPVAEENPSPKMMGLEQFRSLVKNIADFSEDAVVSVSAFGEPLLHPDFVRFAETVLSFPELRLLVETDGTCVNEDLCRELASFGGDRIIWIVQLDAFSEEKFASIYTKNDFAGRVASVGLLKSWFAEVYPQFTRMNENEDELEKFFRFWKDGNSPSQGKLIIQKYDSYCGTLPDRKPADLSPVKRFPCWHLKRDMTILLDGSVPLCREFIFGNIQGNVFEEGLEVVWGKMKDELERHISENYSDCCRKCDEYYTFNF